jgi:peptidoglycan/xylan/chitin deacetylase (PgdA/CDA1 family)
MRLPLTAPVPRSTLLTVALVLAVVACGGRTASAGSARPLATHAQHPAQHPPSLGLAVDLPRRTLHVPILMYHRIDFHRPGLPPITQRLTVDPGAFAAQMTWLANHGAHAITQLQLFNALMYGRPLPPHPVMITFDDGYRDVLGHAAPVLKRLGMPATAYVITDRISNGDSSFLTWGDLRLLERAGVTIGSHTVTHADLPSLSDSQARTELTASRRLLERRLGHPVQWLAYPAGREDARIVSLARNAGYVLAVTTQPGADQHAADPLRLSRYEVLDSSSVATVAAFAR